MTLPERKRPAKPLGKKSAPVKKASAEPTSHAQKASAAPAKKTAKKAS